MKSQPHVSPCSLMRDDLESLSPRGHFAQFAKKCDEPDPFGPGLRVAFVVPAER